MILRRKPSSDDRNFDPDVHPFEESDMCTVHPFRWSRERQKRLPADTVRFHFQWGDVGKQRFTDFAVDLTWDDVRKCISLFSREGNEEAAKIVGDPPDLAQVREELGLT